MDSSNTCTAANVYAAADSLGATVSVLSEYADSIWTSDGNSVSRRPPHTAVERLEKLANVLTRVVADIRNAEDVELWHQPTACASGHGSLPANTLSQ